MGKNLFTLYHDLRERIEDLGKKHSGNLLKEITSKSLKEKEKKEAKKRKRKLL